MRTCLDQTMVPEEVVLVIYRKEEPLVRATGDLTQVRVAANTSTRGRSGA